MSVGYEILALGILLHGAAALGIGFISSLIPRKAIGLAAFVLFYLPSPYGTLQHSTSKC